jgi:NitT/TauT family transport system ATP-binding protein
MSVDLADMAGRLGMTVLFVTHSISEAVFLSDRVVVMSDRPGRIEEILTIDLPRPRHLSIRETPEFGKYASEIRGLFSSLGILRDETVSAPLGAVEAGGQAAR